MEGAGKLGFGTLCYMVLGLMEEILVTIVPQKNLTMRLCCTSWWR